MGLFTTLIIGALAVFGIGAAGSRNGDQEERARLYIQSLLNAIHDHELVCFTDGSVKSHIHDAGGAGYIIALPYSP